jgi:hypothetical protein
LGYVIASLFVAVGLGAELQAYGDGSIFAYAIAVDEAWSYHWRNISGRIVSFVLIHAPAEFAGRLTGSPRIGIFVYGALFFAAPLLSLIATRAADPGPERRIHLFACVSTASVLPFVFGCPTEMWIAHAFFWPALAVALKRDAPAIFFVLVLGLVLSHEGGVPLAAGIVILAGVRNLRARAFHRVAAAFAAALLIWACVKYALPPDDYIAGVLHDAAFRFVDPHNMAEPALILTASAVIAFLVLWGATRSVPLSFAIAAAVVVAYWLWLDDSLLAESRYRLRTLMVIVVPCLAGLAFLRGLSSGEIAGSALGFILRPVRRLIDRADARAACAIVFLVAGVAAGEAAKFTAGWIGYKSELRALASGEFSDPELGNPDFVSSLRISPAANRLAWNSTTPYLSVLVAPEMRPTRLVVDPGTGYFWITCARASRDAEADMAVPATARRMIRDYACLHR